MIRIKDSRFFKKFLSITLLCFFAFHPLPPPLQAQNTLRLADPQALLNLSPTFQPALIKGIKIVPENPFNFDFILDVGESKLEGKDLQQESEKLLRYFLASLTIPAEDLWVNLSPGEPDKIIPKAFSQTEMGRDLLAQDYLLKQLTASLMYPEEELGEIFWERVYQKAIQKYGTTHIPVNTFHKVWIVPDKAIIFENKDRAFIVESHLKVMMEKDYLAIQKKGEINSNLKTTPEESRDEFVPTDIMQDVILPAIEKEVNHGTHFTKLRQIYHSLILATWFKQNLQESLLGKSYIDLRKIQGVDIKEGGKDKEKIYQQYLVAFQKGAYNYIREEYDPMTEEIIPRKYFSGGMKFANVAPQMESQDEAMLSDSMVSKLNGIKNSVLVSSFFKNSQKKNQKLDQEKGVKEFQHHLSILNDDYDQTLGRIGKVDAESYKAIHQILKKIEIQYEKIKELRDQYSSHFQREGLFDERINDSFQRAKEKHEDLRGRLLVYLEMTWPDDHLDQRPSAGEVWVKWVTEIPTEGDLLEFEKNDRRQWIQAKRVQNTLKVVGTRDIKTITEERDFLYSQLLSYLQHKGVHLKKNKISKKQRTLMAGVGGLLFVSMLTAEIESLSSYSGISQMYYGSPGQESVFQTSHHYGKFSSLFFDRPETSISSYWRFREMPAGMNSQLEELTLRYKEADNKEKILAGTLFDLIYPYAPKEIKDLMQYSDVQIFMEKFDDLFGTSYTKGYRPPSNYVNDILKDAQSRGASQGEIDKLQEAFDYLQSEQPLLYAFVTDHVNNLIPKVNKGTLMSASKNGDTKYNPKYILVNSKYATASSLAHEAMHHAMTKHLGDRHSGGLWGETISGFVGYLAYSSPGEMISPDGAKSDERERISHWLSFFEVHKNDLFTELSVSTKDQKEINRLISEYHEATVWIPLAEFVTVEHDASIDWEMALHDARVSSIAYNGPFIAKNSALLGELQIEAKYNPRIERSSLHYLLNNFVPIYRSTDLRPEMIDMINNEAYPENKDLQDKLKKMMDLIRNDPQYRDDPLFQPLITRYRDILNFDTLSLTHKIQMIENIYNANPLDARVILHQLSGDIFQLFKRELEKIKSNKDKNNFSHLSEIENFLSVIDDIFIDITHLEEDLKYLIIEENSYTVAFPILKKFYTKDELISFLVERYQKVLRSDTLTFRNKVERIKNFHKEHPLNAKVVLLQLSEDTLRLFKQRLKKFTLEEENIQLKDIEKLYFTLEAIIPDKAHLLREDMIQVVKKFFLDSLEKIKENPIALTEGMNMYSFNLVEKINFLKKFQSIDSIDFMPLRELLLSKETQATPFIRRDLFHSLKAIDTKYAEEAQNLLVEEFYQHMQRPNITYYDEPTIQYLKFFELIIEDLKPTSHLLKALEKNILNKHLGDWSALEILLSWETTPEVTITIENIIRQKLIIISNPQNHVTYRMEALNVLSRSSMGEKRYLYLLDPDQLADMLLIKDPNGNIFSSFIDTYTEMIEMLISINSPHSRSALKRIRPFLEDVATKNPERKFALSAKKALEYLDQLASFSFKTHNVGGKTGTSFNYGLKQKDTLSDQAIVSEEVGGIDLNPKNLTLESYGQKIKFSAPSDSAMLSDIPIDGLTPIVITITPIANLPVELGLTRISR